MAKDSNHLIYVITAIVCFLLGYHSLPQSATGLDSNPRPAQHPEALKEPLVRKRQDEEKYARETFQELVKKQQQSSPDCSRVLLLPIQFNDNETLSWIDSLEIMARALKVALSTERRLVVQVSGDKEDSFCHHSEHEIYCQYVENHHSNDCHPSTEATTSRRMWASPLRKGVQASRSDFFNVQYYGNDDVALLPNPSAWPWPKSWLLEGGLYWERSWGAFWIFSQLLYYLTGSRFNHPEESSKEGWTNAKDIPFHITLLWDPAAQDSLKRKFARNAEKTHAWDRIQTLANHLRGEYIKETKGTTYDMTHWNLAIVVVTDESTTNDAIPFQSWNDQGWKVSIIKMNPRHKPQQEILESIYLSMFLIGSFASPFFRVLTALHQANLISEATFRMRRYWALDIEWLEAITAFD